MLTATTAVGLPFKPPSKSPIAITSALRHRQTHHLSKPAPTPIYHLYPNQTQSKAKHGLFHRLLFSTWDCLWRLYYILISTFGISAMEPWEAVFTLLLFSTLIFLFAVAIVRVPSYAGYAAKRLGYYLFGATTPRISAVREGVSVGETMKMVVKSVRGEAEGARQSLEWCRQVLSTTSLGVNGTATTTATGLRQGVGEGVGGLVGSLS